ncbi:hypothetical protein B0H17DRAFT_1142964 [Mycena rosella]|uniref:F-box domain-containing protein n=1 Tax=Mycena rosella TaxID=1033263 RepID=A0AAD7CW42_MYCRO|nr:hypothetical protein B0H17DRAFT_1142964 [Mycena rosella]
MANLTACSRTLLMPEIVRMICDEANTESFMYSIPPQNTLVSLARTSRMFSDPALDIIWREQDSLAPLVKCMPDTLWEEKIVRHGTNIHLRRPIISTDIPRLLFYSARIRKLHLYTYSRVGAVHRDFLKALDMCLLPGVLMPKLSDLKWSPEPEEAMAMSFIRHLLGPQSQKIDLDLEASAPALSFFPYMKASCPLVSDFRLVLPTDQLTIPVMSDVVCGWQRLQDLTIGNLDLNGFVHVAQLPDLKQLCLGPVADTHSPTHLPDFLVKPSFPALEGFELACDTAQFCVGIIKVVSSRQLKTLALHPLADWTALAWEEIITALHDCIDHKHLDRIEVEQQGERTPPIIATPFILTPATLRPLLKFNLSVIRFDLDPGVEVDDDFLAEIATEWPNLNWLSFGTENLTTRESKVTLNCLIPFARHCPRLASLCIRMDVSEVPVFDQMAGDRISHGLRELHVGASPIHAGHTTPVAAFLSNLFIGLQYIFSPDKAMLLEPFKTYETNWNRVMEMVPVFCSVRTQEEDFWTEELGGGEDSDEDDEQSNVSDDVDANSSTTL